jgi:hypothetical protein
MTDDPLDQQLAAIALGETWLRDQHEALAFLKTLDTAEVRSAVRILTDLANGAYLESYQSEAGVRSMAVVMLSQAVGLLTAAYGDDAEAALRRYRDELLGRQSD